VDDTTHRFERSDERFSRLCHEDGEDLAACRVLSPMDPLTVRAGAIRALIIGVVLVTAFAFFFVYPGHDPEPHGLPIVFVGDGPDADAALGAMRAGDRFDVERVDDEKAARDRILDRTSYGAIVLDGSAPKLLVSSAASFSVSELIRGLGEQSAPGRALEVEDVRQIDRDDPRGISINLVTLATSVPAILGALLMFTLAPGLPGRRKLALLGIFAVLGGLSSVLIVHVGIGAVPGNFIALWGVTSLAIFAIAAATGAIIHLVGPAGTGLSFAIFLMLGNPASGAAGAPELLPSPWSWGGQLLQPGAFATGLRNTAYFDGAHAERWLTVLVA